MTPWHLPPELVARYADGRIDGVTSASVEAHLVRCGPCRAAVRPQVDATRLDRVLIEVIDRVDMPRRSFLERLLHAVGLSDADARLVAATHSLRLSWFAAVAFCLVVSTLAGRADDANAVVFLTLGPLLPVAGVAIAYGPGIDPAYDVALAAPYSGLRLLLLRVAAVVVSTTALLGVAALGLPTTGWAPAFALLPALALSVATLALSTYLTPVSAGVAVALTWLTTIVGTRRVISLEWLTGAPGQLSCLVLLLVGTAIVVARREHFELGSA